MTLIKLNFTFTNKFAKVNVCTRICEIFLKKVASALLQFFCKRKTENIGLNVNWPPFRNGSMEELRSMNFIFVISAYIILSASSF